MIEVHRSSEFDKWLGGLRDATGRYKVLARIARLQAGNPGDVKPVGQGISEMRIASGPGYRVYFVARGSEVAVLLAGGDKSTQAADIAKAKAIAEQWGKDYG